VVGPPAHCRRGGLKELALTHGCHQDCARHGRVRTHQGNVLGDAVASVFLRGEGVAFLFVLAVSFASVCFSARRCRGGCGRARLGDATAIPVVRGDALAIVVVLSVSVAPVFVLGWVTRLCFLSCLATLSRLWSCSEKWLCSLPFSVTRSRLCSCSAARRGRACGRARKGDVVAPAVVVALFDAVVLVVVVMLRHSAGLLVVLGDAVALVVVRDDGVALVTVLGGDAVVRLTVIGCHAFVFVGFLDGLAVVLVVVLGGDAVVLGGGVSQAQKWRLCPLFVRGRTGLVCLEPRYDSVPPVWVRLEGQDRTRPGLVRASRAAVSSHAALGQPVQAPHYAMQRLVLRVQKDVPVVRHRWSHQQDTGSERQALQKR